MPPLGYATTTELFRSAPWAAHVTIDGVPVNDLVDQQVRIAFVGDGPLSERQLVPQTKAASALLAGADGARTEHAIRGWLSLQPRDLRTDVAGIAFSTDVRGTTLNYLISDVGRTNGLPIDLRRHMRADEVAALQSAADRFRTGVGRDPQLALEEPFIVAGPLVTRGFLDGAGKGDTIVDPELRPLARWAGQMLTHELMHRVTPLDGPWVWDPDVQYPGKLQTLEEGATELCTRLPSVMSRIPSLMGLPDDRSYLGTDDTPMQALVQLLDRAGLDATKPADEARIFGLLQHTPTDVADRRIADAISNRHQITGIAREQLRQAVTSIFADPGPFDYDQPLDAYLAWQRLFEANLAQRLTRIDAITQTPATKALIAAR